MRNRAWIAVGALATAILLGILGQATDSDLVYLLSGAAFLTAIGVGLALLPVWGRMGLRLPAMPGLFPPVGPGRHWDPTTGAVAPGPRPKKARRK